MTSRPNILFILADDWGYGDLGCYGHEVENLTLRLDRLAREGTRFTRFYVTSPVCSPSRCSMITGHYPGRWQVHAHFSRPEDNHSRHMPNWLNLEAPSIARRFQEEGYRTAHYGKWHLGGGGGVHGHPDAPSVREYGYDDTRTWNGNGPTWRETDLWPVTLHNDMDPVWAANSSRLAVDEAIRFIREGGDRPFFLNVWLKDPHTPLHPTPEQREPFRHLPEPKQTYYSVLHNADRQIGRLLDALEVQGLAENTLVIFTSDNGPEHSSRDLGTAGSVGQMRGRKHCLFDGGIRVPFIARWPGHIPDDRVDHTTWLSAVDLVPTFLDAAGISPGRTWIPDGESMMAAMEGREFRRTDPMFWEWRNADCTGNDEAVTGWPMLGIRYQEYMLLLNPVTRQQALYDTFHDEGQTRDLRRDFPSLTRDLTGQIESYSQCLPGYSTRPSAPHSHPQSLPNVNL